MLWVVLIYIHTGGNKRFITFVCWWFAYNYRTILHCGHWKRNPSSGSAEICYCTSHILWTILILTLRSSSVSTLNCSLAIFTMRLWIFVMFAALSVALIHKILISRIIIITYYTHSNTFSIWCEAFWIPTLLCIHEARTICIYGVLGIEAVCTTVKTTHACVYAVECMLWLSMSMY